MPKKIFKKYMPDIKTIREHKSLKIFGKLLHDGNLWHLNRHSVARAFAAGLFSCFMPIPFQMVLSAAIAILFRANLPISVALVWITNPITMPPIFYFAYKIGTKILQIPPRPVDIQLSVHWLATQLDLIWKPLIIGSLVCGIIASLLGYIAIRIFWRLWVIAHWRKRQHRRIKW